MLIAEARVGTERASRYLVQLCRHILKAAQAHPQIGAHVEWTDDRGVIDFGWGRCSLRALQGVLELRVETPDEESLQRIEQRVADRIEQIGSRDRLTVTWTRLPEPVRLPRRPSGPTDEASHG